jgi:hypothetical protein
MTTTVNGLYEIRLINGKGGMSIVCFAEHKNLHTYWRI